MVYLWIRQDGQPAKVIAVGAHPPGPGKVLAVVARNGADARRVVAERLALIERLAARVGRALSAEDLTLLTAGQPEQAELISAVREVAPAEFTHRHGEAAP